MAEYIDVKKQIEKLRVFLPPEIRRIQSKLKPNFIQTLEETERDKSSFILARRNVPIGSASFFLVLRRWNSFTPSLPANNNRAEFSQHSIGGGYYLFVEGEDNKIDRGYGLVIDPGYNFIHNFGSAGLCLDDIDGIMLTHAHDDHTNDFESLLSLFYQRNDKLLDRKKKKKIDLFLNVGSFKKFCNYLDLNIDNYIGNVIVMSPHQCYKVPGRENFQIFTLKTAHSEFVTKNYALGIWFKLFDKNIVLTSDTGWNFELNRMNDSFLQEEAGVYLSHEYDETIVNLLIAHIGSIKKNEFSINEDAESIQEYFYKSHLGLLGVIAAIEKYKPELCVLSEFGEEMIELREKLTQQMYETCKKIRKDSTCLPGDIGLLLQLDSKKALSYNTGELMDWGKISYKEVLDNSKQRSIKFYNGEYYNGLLKKTNQIKQIEIKNGVKLLNKIEYKDHCGTYKINKNWKIETLLKRLCETMPDLQGEYSLDKKEKAIRLLTALSYRNVHPFDLLRILPYFGGWDLIINFLEYCFYDEDLIIRFLNDCQCKKIVNRVKSDLERKIIKEVYLLLLDTFIEKYLINEKEEAILTYNQIRNLSMEQIFSATRSIKERKKDIICLFAGKEKLWNEIDNGQNTEEELDRLIAESQDPNIKDHYIAIKDKMRKLREDNEQIKLYATRLRDIMIKKA